MARGEKRPHSADVVLEAPEELTLVHRRLEGPNGVHVYTAPEMPGLHHAHFDLETARRTLPAVASELAARQYGRPAHYRYSDDGRKLLRAERNAFN